MPIPRKVVRQKAQLLVAIPPDFRKVLGVSAGAALYWHPHRAGEAVLSRSATRQGGKLPDPQKAAAIAALEAEVYRLTARLERQRSALWNEWTTQAVMKRMHIDLKGYPALDAINERLLRIEHILDPVHLPARARRPRPAPSASVGDAARCRVCGEPRPAHPKPDHAWDTPPVGAPPS